MKRLIRLLMLAMATVPAFAVDPNPNIPQVRPTAIIPMMTAAPTLDGVIGEDEWPTLRVLGFVAQSPGGKDLQQPRFGEFRVGATAETLYIAVRSAVHPDAGVVAKHPPEGAKDIGEAIYDDSIELWIHNGPGQPGAKYYQLMVNSLGATFSKMYDTADGSANLWWSPATLRQAHGVKDGIWTAEFAIAWADLEIADPQRELGLRVCRNYKLPWDQSRWSPGVGAFDSAETMARVRFAAVAPVVEELGWQTAAGISVAVRLRNPGAEPLPVKVKLGYNAEQQPRYYDEWTGELAPGTAVERRYQKDFFTPDGYPALGEILVTSPDGATVYYHRDTKWMTKPGKLWDAAKPKGGNDVVALDLEWHPTPRLLRYRVDYAELATRDAIAGLRLDIVNAADGSLVKSVRHEPPASFRLTSQEPLPELGDGAYQVRLYLDGQAPADKPINSQPFEQRSDFVWLNNDIGKSTAVIPPFTPITVEGRTVSTVLRRHTFNDVGLWSQVEADGTSLLAAPMAFEVTAGGAVAPVTGTLTIGSAAPHQAVTVATWQAGPLHATTTAELDYDGCMKVSLDLAPTDTTVESLDLVIPLVDAAMPLAHICGDGMRINYGGATPAGEGTVWTSLKASRSDLMGTFVPYLWLGGDGPGLAWFAANDRDWIVDPSDQTPAVALERQNGVLTMRVRLIQQPTVLERPHRIVFGLMATPTKPMPTDWRRTGLFGGGKQNVAFLGMCMYWGGQLYGVFPADRDFTVVRKIAEAGKEGKVDTAFFEDYMAKHPSTKAEVRWSSNLRGVAGIVPYTNIRGAITGTDEWRVYQDEWRRGTFQWRQTDPAKSGAIDFAVIPTPSRADFLLYYYREFLRAGLDGIYWDNICLYSNRNPVTGNGYQRADGTFQPEVDIWQLREVTRRTAVLAHELGKTNVSMPHMTNASLAPVFSWTGFYLGWEWKYGDTDWQTRFSREYIRAINTGRQTGNLPGVLEGHTSQIADPAKRAWVQRTRAGVALTHEIIVQMPDSLLARAREALYAIGYGTDACRVYNYWEPNPVAAVTGIDSSWLVADADGATIVILCDWGNGGEASIALDTTRLGLPPDFTAVNWEKPEETWRAVNGKLTIGPLAQHDFRVLTIAPVQP